MRRKNDRYSKLSSGEDSQDITDHIATHRRSHGTDHGQDLKLVPLQSTSSPRIPGSAPTNRKDTWNSAKSSESFISNYSVSSGYRRLKNGLDKTFNRGAHKPLPSTPRYAQGSVRHHPAAEVETTRIGRGVWKDQLLVDRSLRTMALTMCLFASAMIVLVCVYAKPFRERANKFTSSVGGVTRSCREVTRINTAMLLLVNVAATMVLGMSNTYQQLVTSLTVRDIKMVLEKHGDSRVGTNSPLNINHKTQGKRSSWAAWILLICTSIPVHFLANSLIGPSYIMKPPATVDYEVLNANGKIYGSDQGDVLSTGGSFVCWSAFRTGHAHFPGLPSMMMEEDREIIDPQRSTRRTFSNNVLVQYNESSCSSLRGSVTDVDALQHTVSATGARFFSGDGCVMGTDVTCILRDPVPYQCRLNVRMNAAFILMVALVVKAIYMVAVNIAARGHTKQQLLTFGDAIVASASHPELRVQGECMVNARESYRRLNTHACHGHCKNPVDSKTGDEVGHCQKCEAWNSHIKLSNKPQPTIATKIKRSLITNLGNTALTQMFIMIFTSLVLIGFSIFVLMGLIGTTAFSAKDCRQSTWNDEDRELCSLDGFSRFSKVSGGWGGINSSIPFATLPLDSYGSEIASFGISNGAQFLFSLLYFLFIYNFTLVSQETDWGKLEHTRKRLRCTIVQGDGFSQDYLLQLPKKILIPTMMFSILVHWLLGEALHTQEAIWLDQSPGRYVEHSGYTVAYAAFPLWSATIMILGMTGVCWWAFTYRREGFIPQMFGSIRVLCSATTQLDDFPSTGVKWGDLGEGKKFRHAGLSGEEIMGIVPYEIYAGTGGDDDEVLRKTDPT